MDKLPIHLQAAGSYEYKCLKPECWYCDIMFLIEQNTQVVEKEKEEIVIIEMYDHVLKKSKKITPQVKPLTFKTFYANYRLMGNK